MTATWPNGGAPRLVILAAGASSRLGQPKALVPLPKGAPLIRLLDAWPALGPAPIVVTGAHHVEISAALEASHAQVQILQNKGWAQGRTGGLQAAIEFCPDRDFVVAPVDCPRIPRRVFEALLEAWSLAQAPPMGWCAPCVRDPRTGKNRHGHPILIGRALLREALCMGADDPLRNLRTLAQPSFAALVSHTEILEDLDTPADLEQLIREDFQTP
ncbi:MAG: NTP transferase domain-containing protein [Planctomycetes bacterium]|nr:NTP transferase domain-containing protein [Planctomycetota bacterium]